MAKSWRHILLASLLAMFTCGCASVWHDLKPHRLRQWNRGDAPSMDPDFTSISPTSRTGLVRVDRPGKQAEMSANCAEVTLARGQNPQ